MLRWLQFKDKNNYMDQDNYKKNNDMGHQDYYNYMDQDNYNYMDKIITRTWTKMITRKTTWTKMITR